MDKLSTLWQGALLQDTLLQYYRSFHLTTQSILVAIGVGLTVSLLTVENTTKQLIVYGILFLISIVANYLLVKMRKLIIARGEDVSYYHKQIIKFEKENLPKNEMVLTAFKVYQRHNRANIDTEEYFQSFELSDKALDDLSEKGKGHTRLFLDQNLFFWYLLIWIAFHIISLFVILSK